MADPADPALLILTAQISAAYVAANKIDAVAVPDLVLRVYDALARSNAPELAPPKPAVPIDQSVQHEYIVCLEDGARLKMLKSYLKRLGLTPNEYRAKWRLPKSYPMIAPAYSVMRSEIATRTLFGSQRAAVRQSNRVGKRAQGSAQIRGVEEAKQTAASVFANFSGIEPVPTVAMNPDTPKKPTRKRFAQQSIRSISKSKRRGS